MKPALRDLKIGDHVQATVHEALDTSSLIISFQGDLLRVQNESRRAFTSGEAVLLVVASISPLQFRLATGTARARRNGHLDILT